jgi:hypothetical protein
MKLGKSERQLRITKERGRAIDGFTVVNERY